MFFPTILAVAALAGTAVAQGGLQTVNIIFETCSDDAGANCSNTTIAQQVGQQGQIGGRLASNLYLSDAADNVDPKTIDCKTFLQGVKPGPSFALGDPAFISGSNPIKIYGLVCDKRDGSTDSISSTGPMVTGSPVMGNSSTLSNGTVLSTSLRPSATPTMAPGTQMNHTGGAEMHGAGAGFAMLAAVAASAAYLV